MLSCVVGSTRVPLLATTIGEVFDRTVRAGPQRLVIAVCDQLHPHLRRDARAREHFVPNGGGDRWRHFLAQSDKLHARLTYGELHALVDQLAHGLFQLGLRKGDRLGVWLPNCYQYLATQVAAAKLGVVLVTINPGYRAPEAEFAFRKVGLRALMITSAVKTSNYVDMLHGILPELRDHAAGTPLRSRAVPTLEHVISIDFVPERGFVPFDELLVQRPTPAQDLVGELTPNEPINIQFTSGTTGNPKGALLSHRNILNNGFFVGKGIHLTDADRICVPVPLYHCFGMVMGNLAALTHGAAVVYPSATFDSCATLAAVQEERCTAIYGVPTMFIAELNNKDFCSFDIASLRKGIMAGSICPVETMREVIDLMHCTGMTICYGQTETSPVSFQTSADDPIEARVETVGRIHPHLECKVINEDGATVAVGERGELCTRGYSVMLGYWDDPHKTAETIDEDGWLHTGDQAVIDDKGYCRIVGRIKDLIIRGGENISPREIEDVLFEDHTVLNVSVVGVPDRKYGEAVCAFVITKEQPGMPVVTREADAVAIDLQLPPPADDAAAHPYADLARRLSRASQARLAHFKVPRFWVFTSEFPMTVTGKVQKYLLREHAGRLLRL